MSTDETEAVIADAGEQISRYAEGVAIGPQSDRSTVERIPEEIPAAVQRYLIPGEQRSVLALHRHPAVLAKEAAVLLGSLAAAILLNSWGYYHGQATPFNVYLIWLMFLTVAAWYGWKAVVYRVLWIVITPVRILTISGLVTRKVEALPMKRIRDMQLDRTSAGRIFGYGTLRTESLGTDHALNMIRYVPTPDMVYSMIWSILLPKKGVSPMTDEVN